MVITGGMLWQKNNVRKKLPDRSKKLEFYKPGGGFGEGVEAGLKRGRTKSMASGMNALIGSGLAGTTMAAGLGKKYEEEVAAPIMAGVESTRAQNLSALNVSMGQAQQSASQFSQSQALQKYMADLQAKGQAGQLGLGYAQLNAQGQPTATIPSYSQPTAVTPGNNNFRVPTVAPSLFAPAPTTTTAKPKTWSSSELTALNQKLGNIATGF